jgi:mRNA-degrading endonuclease YafQ of YafQ-DinJ toxin-antitoxin module
VRTLVWSPSFVRAFKRVARHDPGLLARTQRALEILVEDPFHPNLHTHKLKGELAGVWACTVDYKNRLLFEIVRDPSSFRLDNGRGR